MENNENTVVRTEEEIRQDLMDQMAELAENDSCDPAEISEDEGGVNLGLVGGLVGGVVLGTVGVIKVVKDFKNGKVQERIDDTKRRFEIKRERRRIIKEIQAEAKEKIKATKHPVKEIPAEATEEPATEPVDSKKTSKK